MSQQHFDSPEDALAHFGVKGMKWGVRKDKITGEERPLTPEERASRNKKIAIGIGVLTVAAGLAYTGYAMNNRGSLPVSSVKNSDVVNAGKKKVEKTLQEPTDIIHLARGKNVGLTFQRKGNTPDFADVFHKLGMNADGLPREFVRKVEDGSGTILARMADPLSRRDFAGRLIQHDIVIPKSMASGIETLDDVRTKIYPKLKDTYDAFYEASLKERF